MFKLEDIFKAYLDCRKHKRNTASAIEFEIEFDTNCILLHSELNNRSYQVSESIAFIVNKPRKREIFAANFRDRVLHHLVDLKLRPLLEEEFISRTFNNRKGKGTSKAIDQLNEDIRTLSENYRVDCWVAKMDIKGFFMSINKDLLIERILYFIEKRYEGDDKGDLKWLVETILRDNPEKHCILKSPLEEWRDLDPSKSLFHIDDNLGLPIGNLISQLLANFYLNDFDHYVMDTLEYSYYGRYVDDFYILSRNKDRLLEDIPRMREKLAEVGLVLHPDKFYFQHYSKGVEFVGAVVKPGRIYIHNRTIHNAKETIREIISNKTPATQRDLARVNSYIGFMVNRNTYAIRRSLLTKAIEKQGLFTSSRFKKAEIANKHKESITVLNRLQEACKKSKRRRNKKESVCSI